MGLFGDIFSIVSDVTTVVTAPVKVVASTTKIITKPIANEVDDLVKAIEKSLK